MLRKQKRKTYRNEENIILYAEIITINQEEQKKQSKLKMCMHYFVLVLNILVGISTVIIGFATYKIYWEQLKISQIEHLPSFSCEYSPDSNELTINKINGNIRNIKVDINCEYRACVMDYSDNGIVINDVPFTINPDVYICAQNMNEESFYVDLTDSINTNMETSQSIVDKFNNENYGCQMNITYIITISYENEYDDGKSEVQRYALRTNNAVYGIKGVRLSFDSNFCELITNRVEKINDDSACINAARKSGFNWDDDSVTMETIIETLSKLQDELKEN